MTRRAGQLGWTRAAVVGATVAMAGAILVLSGGRDAEAFPAYSTKEKKPCSFCHVRASGGGKRNAAGDYYKAHSLSLVGFGGAAPALPVKPVTKPKPVKTPVKSAKKATGKKA